MQGGYVMFDISDLDFTSSSKQTTKIFTDRLGLIFGLNKPILVYGIPNHSAFFGSIVKNSTAYTLTYVDGTNVNEILFETTGTTITTTDVENPTSGD